MVAQLPDDGVVALVRVLGLGRRALHRGHSRRRAQLAVVVLALSFYLHHTHLVVFLPGRDDVRAMPVGVLEYARTDFGGHAPVADEIVLGETLARNAEYGGGIDGVVLRLVKGEALRRAVDVHALKVAVALHDALARRVVGVAAGLAVVRQGHQAVLLVPRHAPLRVQAVVLHERGVAVGVVGVTLVPYLRGRGGVVGVAVLVGQHVAARNRTRIGALRLGERLAHQSEAHVHGVAQALGLATGLHQSVKLVVGVGVAERTAQRFLLLSLADIGTAHTVRTARPSEPFRLLRRLWCNNVGQPQNIVYGVVFILRLHDAVSVGR